MPLWDANGTSNTIPTWYRDTSATKKNRPGHPNAAEPINFTDRGWERTINYTDQHGNVRQKREVVVANRQMTLDKVAGGQKIYVVDLEWGNVSAGDTLANGEAFTFKVIFNQPVMIPPSASNVNWEYISSNDINTQLGYLISGNTTNVLTFEGTANLTHSVPHYLLGEHKIGYQLFVFDPDTGKAKVGTVGAWGDPVHANGTPTGVDGISEPLKTDSNSNVFEPRETAKLMAGTITT